MTTNVLFINAEAAATALKNSTSVIVGRVDAYFSRTSLTASNLPVHTRAALRTNIAAIVAGAGFARAARTSVGLTSPLARATAAPQKATTDEDRSSRTNA
jgi:hypothetical protein